MKHFIDLSSGKVFGYTAPDTAREVTDEQFNWAIANNPSTIEEVLAMELAEPPEPTLEELKDIEAAKAAREHETELRVVMQEALTELVNAKRGPADAKLAARLDKISKATTKEELLDGENN